MMKLIVPHLRRAVLIGEVIDLRKVEAAGLADTLDGIAAALFLVDADGRVVHANVSGHQMLTEGHVVRSVSGKLEACNQNSNQTLREVLAVAGGDDMKVDVKGVAVSLVAPNSEPHIAHVLPLSSGARRKAGVAYSAVAAVFVRKATLDLIHPLEALVSYYKLTPTELRVLMSIVQVGGVLQAAQRVTRDATPERMEWEKIHKLGENQFADRHEKTPGSKNPVSQNHFGIGDTPQNPFS